MRTVGVEVHFGLLVVQTGEVTYVIAFFYDAQALLGERYGIAEVLTGCKNPREAALKLANWGVKEVLLTLGSMGSVIYADGEFHEIPAYPPTEIVDATGCGDTYMAGYLYMRNKGASYKEAGCFAAAMCTIKLEASGPFGGTEKDVWDIIERYK